MFVVTLQDALGATAVALLALSATGSMAYRSLARRSRNRAAP